MLLFLLLLLYVTVGITEVLLWERKDKTKLTVYCIFMLGAFILGVLLLLDVDVPSPARFIEAVIGFQTKR